MGPTWTNPFYCVQWEDPWLLLSFSCKVTYYLPLNFLIFQILVIYLKDHFSVYYSEQKSSLVLEIKKNKKIRPIRCFYFLLLLMKLRILIVSKKKDGKAKNTCQEKVARLMCICSLKRCIISWAFCIFPLAADSSILRYKLAYSSNYSNILDPIIENNYQLFMVERLIMMGAKTFIKTFKEDDTDLSLTDDPKKNTKLWQIPVYTKDGDDCWPSCLFFRHR